MYTYLAGKVCLVTGASSGIGFTLAQQLLENGAIVYLANRKPENQAEARGALAKYGDRARFSIVNVREADSVSAWINVAKETCGKIDMLINNAGVSSSGKTSEIPLYKWQAILDTNLWGVIYGVNAVLPIMEAQGYGHIINMASLDGLIPAPYQAVYVTSKYAVVGLSESLRYELEPSGVKVSVICPGNVATGIFTKDANEVPKDSITVAYAANYILDWLAHGNSGILPVAEYAQEVYDMYRSDEKRGSDFLRSLQKRREPVFGTKECLYDKDTMTFDV